LTGYRALLIEYRALLIEYRALLIEYGTIGQDFGSDSPKRYTLKYTQNIGLF